MSITYYNQNAKNFITDTFTADMSQLTTLFLSHVAKLGFILDLGCGSGRDSVYFDSLGYQVTAIDGSVDMINHAKKYLGDKAQLSTFEDFQTNQKFDGIWALASLLHVEKYRLKEIIQKYCDMLSNQGVFFMSFKNREKDYEKDGRHFSCFSKASLDQLLKEIVGVEILSFYETVDVRVGRNEELWISVLIRKQSGAM